MIMSFLHISSLKFSPYPKLLGRVIKLPCCLSFFFLWVLVIDLFLGERLNLQRKTFLSVCPVCQEALKGPTCHNCLVFKQVIRPSQSELLHFQRTVSRRNDFADMSGLGSGAFVCVECSFLFSLSIFCQLWQALHSSILPSLHFFIWRLALSPLHGHVCASAFAALPGLEIVSLALALITVLSRSVSLSFRGVDWDPLSQRSVARARDSLAGMFARSGVCWSC